MSLKISIFLVEYNEDSYIDIFTKLLEKGRVEGDIAKYACIIIGDKNKALLTEEGFKLVKDQVNLIMKKEFLKSDFYTYTPENLLDIFQRGIEGNIRQIK